MARRGSGNTAEAPVAGPVAAPVVPPSWPAPQGGHAPVPVPVQVPGSVAPPAAGRVAERPGASPRAVAGRPPAVGANGLPDFAVYVNQTDLGEVEMDDQFKVLPDDLYVEGEIKSCEYEQGDNRNLRLVLRIGLTYPAEHRGVTIKDWVTLPDEMLQGSTFNAISKRWKMFLDACEKLSEDGRHCTARDFREFVGEIVGFRTKNKESQKVLPTGEVKTTTYTNVGFAYYRADKTDGLQPSGETVSVVAAAWRPQS